MSLVVRPRLLRRLDDAGAFPVTILGAPSGYGKTVVLRQYMARSNLPGAVIDLPPRPSHLAVLAAALAAQVPGDLAGSPMFRATERDPWRLARAVAQRLNGYTGILAVEACHDGAETGEFETFLMELVERCPAVRWIFTTNEVDALPYATWMAYRQLEGIIGAHDLRFTAFEAIDVGKRLGVSDPERAVALHALTGGWPSAFVVAARGFATVGGGTDPLERAHTVLDHFLDEQILTPLDAVRRKLLLTATAFDVIDVRTVGPLFGADRETLERLLKATPLVHAEGRDAFRFDPLLRAFAERRRDRDDRERGRRLLIEAARLQLALPSKRAAVETLIRAEAHDELFAVMEREGFGLVESDAADVVACALAVVDAGRRSPSPIILALRGSLEAIAGRFSYANTLFHRACELAADDSQALAITYHRALMLVKWSAPAAREPLAETIGALRGLLGACTADEAMTLRVRAAVALGCTILGDDVGAAAKEMRDVLSRVETSTGDDELRALVYHQASFVALARGELRRAREWSAIAIELARRSRLFALVARAFSIRSAVSIQVEGRYEDGLRELDQMAEYAAKAGDTFLILNAAFGRYDLLAEKGAEEDLDALEALVERERPAVETSTVALPYGRALRAAWRGDLDEGYRLLADTAQEQETPARRFRRWAEVALFAAFCGRRAEGEEALSRASESAAGTSDRGEDMRRLARGSAIGAIAFAALGRVDAGRRFLERFAPPVERSGREGRALAEAARAACLAVEIGDRAELAHGVSALTAVGLKGLAALVECCPIDAVTTASPLQRLTKTELLVLRLIARGGTSEDVAAQLGRSTHTINVHVAAILRKLACRTRKQAVALALKSGLF